LLLLCYTDAVEIRKYITDQHRCPFDDWMRNLKDKNAYTKIQNRLDRLILGNFGDFKPLGKDVAKLRIPTGKGYRVYYGRDSESIVLLLCGGDKSNQAKDIEKAKRYWRQYNTMPSAPYSTSDYLNNAEDIVRYLNITLEDKDTKLLLLALRNVAKSKGMKELAETTGLNRENLYRMLSKDGNPKIENLLLVLDALGLRLSVKLTAAA